MDKIVFAPKYFEPKEENVYVTGNHYLSISNINGKAQINRLGFISTKLNGLIDLSGVPFVSPVISFDNKVVNLKDPEIEYENDFVPKFHFKSLLSDIIIKIYCPEMYKGFVYDIEIKPKKKISANIKLEVKVVELIKTIQKSFSLKYNKDIFIENTINTGIINITNNDNIVCLGLAGDKEYFIRQNDNGLDLEYNTIVNFDENKRFSFYFSIDKEIDGVLNTILKFKNLKSDYLYEELSTTLKARHIDLDDYELEKIANLNMNFCYYYSVGYSMDQNYLVLINSKSSRYYSSGCYNAKNFLLYAFPCILKANLQMAKDILRRLFASYLRNTAYGNLYLDGTILQPSVGISNLLAPIIALNYYIEQTGDNSFLSKAGIKQGIKYILKELEMFRDPNLALYKSEIDGINNLTNYQYRCFDNMLVVHCFEALASYGYQTGKKVKELRDAIDKYFIVEKNNNRIYSTGFDGKLKNEFIDIPLSSLLIMPRFDFVDSIDLIYKNSVDYYFSTDNNYYYVKGRTVGQGCDYVENIFPLSICNIILGHGRTDKLVNLLRNMKLDNGIMCESIDLQTSKVRTGAAFASGAGYFANTIFYLFSK